MLSKLRYIFTRKEKIKIFLLLIMIIIGSFLELIGLAVFMPFISMIMDAESTIGNNKIISILYSWLNPGSTRFFIVELALGISAVYIIKNIYLAYMQNCILNFSYTMRMEIATRLLATYMHEPYTFHLSRNIAELQRSLQIDANQFMQLVNTVLQSIAEMTVVLAFGIYLFNTSHSITIIVMGLLILCLGVFSFISKHVSDRKSVV